MVVLFTFYNINQIRIIIIILYLIILLLIILYMINKAMVEQYI
jgi:uncharacterized integral membrane protein